MATEAVVSPYRALQRTRVGPSGRLLSLSLRPLGDPKSRPSGGTIRTRGNNTVEASGTDINGNVVPYSVK